MSCPDETQARDGEGWLPAVIVGITALLIALATIGLMLIVWWLS